MIEEARPSEHSGPYFALLKWDSAAKQPILYAIFINMFAAPLGARLRPVPVGRAAGDRRPGGQGGGAGRQDRGDR